MTGETTPIERLIASAGPAEPRTLAGLLERLLDAGLLAGPVGAALAEQPVLGVTEDSRAAGGGRLFVAVPGFHVDGHEFAARAASTGAAAAIVEHEIPGLGIPRVLVTDARRALAAAAG